MAKRIIWSRQAQNDRINILEFWIDHNQSPTYSIKLNQLFKEAVKLIAKFPDIGKPTDMENVKGKIVRDYYIYYEVKGDALHILTVWDTRQNPDELEEKLKTGKRGH